MDPYWMYRVGKDGEVESKLFDTKKEPKGWYDSPPAAKAAVKAKKPEKVDDNSARDNQQLSLASGDTGAESDVTRGNELGRVKPIKPDVRPLEE